MGLIYSNPVDNKDITSAEISEKINTNDQVTDQTNSLISDSIVDNLNTISTDIVNQHRDYFESDLQPTKRVTLSDKTKLLLAHEILKVNKDNTHMDLVQHERTLFLTQQIIDTQSVT